MNINRCYLKRGDDMIKLSAYAFTIFLIGFLIGLGFRAAEYVALLIGG